MTICLPRVATSGAGRARPVGGREWVDGGLGNVDSLGCSWIGLDRDNCRLALASFVLVGRLHVVFGVGLETDE